MEGPISWASTATTASWLMSAAAPLRPACAGGGRRRDRAAVHRAQSLNVEDGKVTGVTAQANEGTTYVITENVVGDRRLRRERHPAQRRAGSRALLRPSTSTGDGVIMATADGINGITPDGIRQALPERRGRSKGIAKSTIAGNIAGWR
ncbi:MAG: FAD-binding protein [Christensenellales bacterium]